MGSYMHSNKSYKYYIVKIIIIHSIKSLFPFKLLPVVLEMYFLKYS